MKRWYSFYNERITNRQRPIDENCHQAGDELEIPEQFGEIPWEQHIEIMSKCGKENCSGMVSQRHPKTSWCRHLPTRTSY